MKVKLFTTSSGWGKPVKQFDELEVTINAWLADHPEVVVEHVHRMSQPSFGWGQLGVAVWHSGQAELPGHRTRRTPP
jgi:hypothetical protein